MKNILFGCLSILKSMNNHPGVFEEQDSHSLNVSTRVNVVILQTLLKEGNKRSNS